MKLQRNRLFVVECALCAASLLAPLGASAWECQGVLIRQSGPSQAAPGAELTYDIEVINADSGDACNLPGARITDYLPRRVQFLAAQPTPLEVINLPVGKVMWPPQDLKPSGGQARFQVRIAASEPAGRIITNTVCVEHDKIGRVCQDLDTFITKARP